MPKLQTFSDLKLYRDALKNNPNTHDGGVSDTAIRIKIAMATCSIASGAKKIMNYFEIELQKRNIEARITQTGCMGYCYAEPTIEVLIPGKEAVIFGDVDILKADQIIEVYIKEGNEVDGVIPVNFQSID